jgi:hypothetical protein
MESQWLSPTLVDTLSENQQDWISRLQNDWAAEVYNINLQGVNCGTYSLKHSCLTVSELVALTLQVPYQSVEIAQNLYSYYSCCFQVVGLGRVRGVISFSDQYQTDAPFIFLTNRLNWSPRNILTQWIEHYPSAMLSHTRNNDVVSCPIHRPLNVLCFSFPNA